MEFELLRHGGGVDPAIKSIRVRALRHHGGRLSMVYRVEGDISALVIPQLMSKERADGLWETTCFEAFLGVAGRTSYIELNFSPSTRWAAYAFEDVRAGMRVMEGVSLPRLDIRAGHDLLEIGVVIDLSSLTSESQRWDWQLGLCAVIEMRDGRKSYWALAHGGDVPDFHDRDCFRGLLRAATPA